MSQRILAHLPVPHLFMGVSVAMIAVMAVLV